MQRAGGRGLTGIGANWSASYRADGLRAKKTVSGTSTYFLYDGGLPVAEMNSSGAVTATNVFAPDGLVARQQAGSWIFYAFDQQGNVAQRLNLAGAVLSSSVYDAYGVESSTGSPTDPFGFNAQWGYNLDRETGLYACMFRYYDPAQGRWLNRDPIGFAGGVNLYGYCGGGPVGWADPSGKSRLTWLYDLVERVTGRKLKTGISYTPGKRYTKGYLDSVNADLVKREPFKERPMARSTERGEVEAAGPGELPLNNEPWSPNGRAKKAAKKAAQAGGLLASFLDIVKECAELIDPTPIGLGMDLGKLGGALIQPWAERNQSMNWRSGFRSGWKEYLEEDGS